MNRKREVVCMGIDVLRQDIMEDIKRTNRSCPPEELDYYISANFPRDFTQATLLPHYLLQLDS